MTTAWLELVQLPGTNAGALKLRKSMKKGVSKSADNLCAKGQPENAAIPAAKSQPQQSAQQHTTPQNLTITTLPGQTVLYTSSWTAQQMAQHEAAALRTPWLQYVSLSSDAVFTLEEYGYAQVGLSNRRHS